MKPIMAVLFGVAIQTVFGGLLGGLVLKPLAARIAKINISFLQAWAVEFGSVFVTVSIAAIVDLLEILNGSGLLVIVGFLLLLLVVSRTIAYSQCFKGSNGRNIGALDALPLALVQSGVILAIGITVRSVLAIGNHLGVSLL